MTFKMIETVIGYTNDNIEPKAEIRKPVDKEGEFICSKNEST